MSPCIAPDQFQRMLAEQLTAADHQALDAHVETCSPRTSCLIRSTDCLIISYRKPPDKRHGRFFG
jgi:hypothetical protein